MLTFTTKHLAQLRARSVVSHNARPSPYKCDESPENRDPEFDLDDKVMSCKCEATL